MKCESREPVEVVETQPDYGDMHVDNNTNREHETDSHTQIAPSAECHVMLDTIDSCVACVDGVDAQHHYEENLLIQQPDSSSVAEHGLTNVEAAMIRLQVMEEEKKKSLSDAEQPLDALESIIPMDTLNFCGNDENEVDAAVAALKVAAEAAALSQVDNEAKSKRVQTTIQSGLGFPNSPGSTHSAEGLASSPSGEQTCGICFDEAGGTTPESPHSTVTFCHLPCCESDGREETTATKVCTVCILLLTNPTSDGLRIGRCPRCRSWIAVSTETNQGSVSSIQQVESAGQCKICNQVKSVLVENGEVCDACFLGRRKPLVYECEQCHATQNIPHPMYRYQNKADEFGKTSWKCQGLCQHFTMWRILTEQVRYIPTGDTPEEWNDNYLEIARARVREARRGFSESNNKSAWNAKKCIIS